MVAAIRSAQADLGVVYASDTVRVDGCRVLGRIDRLATSIRYEAAVLATMDDATPAVDLLRLIADPATVRFANADFGSPFPPWSGP